MFDIHEELKTELRSIALLDMIKAYDDRNRAVIKAVWLAQLAGYQAGFRFDPDEPEWPVAFIELPTGQVSWHIAQHPTPWDGHSTEEKYRRARAFCAESLTLGDAEQHVDGHGIALGGEIQDMTQQ